MDAIDILGEAAAIVSGPRQQTHGNKERSFELIGKLWTAYLSGRAHTDVTGADVAAMMVLLKIARSIQGEPVNDHFIDMCGYAAIYGELCIQCLKPLTP